MDNLTTSVLLLLLIGLMSLVYRREQKTRQLFNMTADTLKSVGDIIQNHETDLKKIAAAVNAQALLQDDLVTRLRALSQKVGGA